MNTDHLARPERRSHRWFREGAVVAEVKPDPLDDRSMRRLELGVAGSALAVVAMLSLTQPGDAGTLRTIEILVVGGVLFISALVSLIR